MKKILSIILSAVIIVCVASACAKQEPAETTAKEVSSSETTATTTTAAATTNTTKKETKGKAFDKWDEVDLVNYFKAEKVFDNEDNLSVIQKDEELPKGVSAEIDYDNHNNDEVYVLIYYLDAESNNKETEKVYNQIKNNKCAKLEGNDDYEQPFNALVGRFAIFYSSSIDEKFVNKFETALDKLIKEQGVKPVYYEKNLDLSKFNQDDNVVIIEGDD